MVSGREGSDAEGPDSPGEPRQLQERSTFATLRDQVPQCDDCEPLLNPVSQALRGSLATCIGVSVILS